VCGWVTGNKELINIGRSISKSTQFKLVQQDICGKTKLIIPLNTPLTCFLAASFMGQTGMSDFIFDIWELVKL